MSLFVLDAKCTKQQLCLHVILLIQFFTCLNLRTIVTQNIKMPNSTVHFLVQHEYRFLLEYIYYVF